MPAHKAPPWSREEVAILREHYPVEGLNGVADLLPDRSWQAIYVMASKLGIRTQATSDAPKPKLGGHVLEEAIRLREVEGWSFARIGASFGVCESSATNAVLMALCVRKGFRPAERDAKGRLTDAAKERLRLMLRKGLKGVEIQLRLGVSAACVAEQRRRYARDLKARGKAALPPPGGGERYSGAKIERGASKRIEALYLEGFGTQTIAKRTGVSKTHCLRVRTKLVNRLHRKGEALPGCDRDGVRRVQKESARFIPGEAKASLRRRLLDGDPVRSAALELGIGLCSAYRIRDALIAELADEGRELPRSDWRSRPRKGSLAAAAEITGTRNIYRLRALCRTMPADQARAALFAELDEERRRCEAEARARREADKAARANRSFAEKLAALERGEVSIAPALVVPRRGPDITLGGVATGALL